MCQGAAQLVVIVGALAAWLSADLLQARVAQPALWGALDLVAHAAVAALCVAWLVPSWGWAPVVVAACAATALDVDHIATARFEGARITSLGTRSALHSLVGILVLTGLAGWLGNPRVALATGAGLLTHLCRDATQVPGIPLWVPFNAADDVMLPSWTLPALVTLLSAGALLVARGGLPARWGMRPRRHAPPAQ